MSVQRHRHVKLHSKRDASVRRAHQNRVPAMWAHTAVLRYGRKLDHTHARSSPETAMKVKSPHRTHIVAERIATCSGDSDPARLCRSALSCSFHTTCLSDTHVSHSARVLSRQAVFPSVPSSWRDLEREMSHWERDARRVTAVRGQYLTCHVNH